jgi:peroxiredoxin
MMVAKRSIKILLPAAVFVIAGGLTYLGVTQWTTRQPEQRTKDTLDGVQGLVEGEAIALPELRTMAGETVALNQLAADKLLLVFFTPACAGCAMDAGLWRDLNVESTKRGKAFYLIDVGNDRDALAKFATAHNLANVPILFDDRGRVGSTLKVNIVPQYLLVARDGKVLHRWDGLRRFEQPPRPEQLAKFFQSAGD